VSGIKYQFLMTRLEKWGAIVTESPRSDLEDRTFQFAKGVRGFVRRLPRTLSNIEDVRQLVRASGSVGANYIEAQEALSRKDFGYRIRIVRKESKEARYWLNLVSLGASTDLITERDSLIREASELIRIMSAIIAKSSST